MKAAVLYRRREPMVVEEIRLADPGPGEVEVELAASGVCHSDYAHWSRDTWSQLPLVLDQKLEFAREFGATHLVNAKREGVLERVQELTGGLGADYAFEVIGAAPTIRQAFDVVRKGGTAVVVGVAREEEEVTFPAPALMRTGKRLLGCNYGSTRPQVDFPKIIDLFIEGRLKLRELISRRFELAEINQAFRALHAGEVARGIVDFG